MSLIGLLILAAEFWTNIEKIYIKRANTFINNHIFYSDNEMENFNTSLGQFNNSANFIFGLSGGEIFSD